jgi:hypothetical protein
VLRRVRIMGGKVTRSGLVRTGVGWGSGVVAVAFLSASAVGGGCGPRGSGGSAAGRSREGRPGTRENSGGGGDRGMNLVQLAMKEGGRGRPGHGTRGVSAQRLTARWRLVLLGMNKTWRNVWISRITIRNNSAAELSAAAALRGCVS